MKEHKNHHKARQRMPIWEASALLQVAGLALLQSVWSLFTWPFMRRRENVQLYFHPTPTNKALLEAMGPLIESYTPCPWATGEAAMHSSLPAQRLGLHVPPASPVARAHLFIPLQARTHKRCLALCASAPSPRGARNS